MDNVAIADSLISHFGRPVRVSADYPLIEPAVPGDLTLHLKRAEGLMATQQLTLGNETLTIASVSLATSEITLSSPILGTYETGIMLKANIDTTGVFKDTPDPSVRVPIDTPVRYGSIVDYNGLSYLVISLHYTTQSVSLGLKRLLYKLTRLRVTPGDYNGFGYDNAESTLDFQASVGIKNSGDTAMSETEVGIMNDTVLKIMITDTVDIIPGDLLNYGSTKYKVTDIEAFQTPGILIITAEFEGKI